MGLHIKFEFNDKARERIAAGLAFLYTTKDGDRWYIDTALNLPYRQIDLAEATCDALSLDGLGFYPHYPSLSICQFALEEGCPEWHGEGWYWLYTEGDPEHAEWVDDIGKLREKVAALDATGKAVAANYGGDGSEAVIIY